MFQAQSNCDNASRTCDPNDRNLPANAPCCTLVSARAMTYPTPALATPTIPYRMNMHQSSERVSEIKRLYENPKANIYQIETKRPKPHML